MPFALSSSKFSCGVTMIIRHFQGAIARVEIGEAPERGAFFLC